MEVGRACPIRYARPPLDPARRTRPGRSASHASRSLLSRLRFRSRLRRDRQRVELKIGDQRALKKMARLAWLALDNAFELHADSVLLWMSGSYGPALALSVLAAEELGKCFIAEEFVWQSSPDSPQDPHEWVRDMYNHGVKQGFFASHLFGKVPDARFTRISDGALEHEKQHALYVGYPRKKVGKGIDLDARLMSPRRTGRVRAASQVTLVSDFLLMMTTGVASGSWIFENEAFGRWLHIPMARWLRRIWPMVGKKAREHVRRVYPRLFEVEKQRELKLGIPLRRRQRYRWSEAYKAMGLNPRRAVWPSAPRMNAR